MTAQNDLDISGTCLAFPFAELVAEMAQGELSGSIRLAKKDKKVIVYFRDGRLVFAVSNSRMTRLFDFVLQQNKLTKEQLVQLPNFSNDLQLAEQLLADGLLTEAEKDMFFTAQVRAIVSDVISWEEGEWTITPLARVREGLLAEIDERSLLQAFGRGLSPEAASKRFRSFDERFELAVPLTSIRDCTPGEARVLVPLASATQSVGEIVAHSGIEEKEAFAALYSLWLAGLVIRSGWQSAIPAAKIPFLRAAKLELKREAILPGVTREEPAEEAQEQAPAEEITLTLEQYLKRTEAAKNHYEVLGVDPKCDAAVLKDAYFSLAKLFHPDKFRKESPQLTKRVHSAFAQLAAAHETLRTPDSRELYDFKIRKDIEAAAGGSAGADSPETGDQKLRQAAEEFNKGAQLLAKGDSAGAQVHLARAAHADPQNAKYRAYYGSALSADDKHRHKAEGELQAAIRIDGNSAEYRMMLSHFFIKVKLLRRAEGELTRLLALHPNHREARELLDSLK
ncbi:MAG: DnaJ domain-containing protein [Acidobacteria bacterium]|nr:DnaJ domain-containing protein [Acidobacteriota bacterium]